MTAAQAASRERNAIFRKIRRIKKTYPEASHIHGILDDLEEWILDRDTRYNRRPGGMGK